ncbi:MAG: enolase C-terminal domain-like protein [Armatimonadota bacterium]|nr:enolase C-terminal domain-like protein [Armatimonadota bacterium]
MRITSVETFRVGLPRRRVHRWAFNYVAAGSDYVLVRISTDAGISGIGEAPVLPDWGGDYGTHDGEYSVGAVDVIDRWLRPVLIEQDPFQIDVLHARMDAVIRGHPYAKAAIDVALHDLKGRALGVPVYELLGGLVRREVPLAHSIGLMDIEPALAEIAAVVEEGVKTIKLKIGVDPQRDVELVRRTRELVGPAIKIRVDANQGYPTPKLALQVLRRMQDYDVWFMEQPVMGIRNLARVSRATDVPIMADESAWTTQEVLEIIRLEAAELISLYYTKPGGLYPAKQVAAVAEAGGLACDVNGSAETGIGNMANIHLAASTRNVTIPGSIPVNAPAGRRPTRMAGHYYTDDLIKEPYEFRDGCFIVPDRPGLGVDLDEEKLLKYRVA